VSPLELDLELTRAAAELRLPWLTPLWVVLSAWWVKGPLLALLAGLLLGAAIGTLVAWTAGARRPAGDLASGGPCASSSPAAPSTTPAA